MEVKSLEMEIERLAVMGLEREIEKWGTTELERERDIQTNIDWGLRA